MKKVLVLAAIGEAATGLGAADCSVARSPVVVRSGTDRSFHPSSARARHRLDRIGVCLLAAATAHFARMLTYSALAMAYLLYLGIRGEWVGPLLWPAVVLHAVLTLLLARAWCKTRKDTLT